MEVAVRVGVLTEVSQWVLRSKTLENPAHFYFLASWRGVAQLFFFSPSPCNVMLSLIEHCRWRIRSHADPESAPRGGYRAQRPKWPPEVGHYREDGGKRWEHLRPNCLGFTPATLLATFNESGSVEISLRSVCPLSVITERVGTSVEELIHTKSKHSKKSILMSLPRKNDRLAQYKSHTCLAAVSWRDYFLLPTRNHHKNRFS